MRAGGRGRACGRAGGGWRAGVLARGRAGPAQRRLATKICTIELCVDRDSLSPNASPRFGRHPGRSQSPAFRRGNGSTSPAGRRSPAQRSPGRLRSPARSPEREGGAGEPEPLDPHAPPSKFASAMRERIRADGGGAAAAGGGGDPRRMSLPNKAYSQG